MKLHIISPDQDSRIDGTIKAQILDNLPDQVGSVLEADVLVLPISYFSDFRFNEELHKLKGKTWCVIDFLEYSTFWDGKETHLLGKNLHVAKNLCDNPEWQKLDQWVRDNPPVMYFKRELLRKDVSDRVKPISFLAYMDKVPVQSKHEFLNRPLDCFFFWGYSHASRPRLHGELVNTMATHGFGVLTHWDQIDGYLANPHPKTTIASIYSPWWVRRPMSEVMQWQNRSKISISLPGAGSVCFRHLESPQNCVMALHQDETAWPSAYEWEHGQNCIRLEPGQELRGLLEWIGDADLYSLYVYGQANIGHYYPQNYIPNYLIPTIEGAL